MQLSILFEDRHCLVVNKPSRLLTASDHTGEPTLWQTVQSYALSKAAEGKKGYVAPLHFLDKPVSGCILYALSSKAAARLSDQFRTRKLKKTYWAIVTGNKQALLKAQQNPIWEDLLLKDKDKNLVKVLPNGRTHPEAKPARLRFTYMRELAPNTHHVALEPETGRSHQIRVQLASRGFPIWGDKKYGSSGFLDGAILLHAREVCFMHPISKEWINIQAPLPQEFAAHYLKDET